MLPLVTMSVSPLLLVSVAPLGISLSVNDVSVAPLDSVSCHIKRDGGALGAGNRRRGNVKHLRQHREIAARPAVALEGERVAGGEPGDGEGLRIAVNQNR